MPLRHNYIEWMIHFASVILKPYQLSPFCSSTVQWLQSATFIPISFLPPGARTRRGIYLLFMILQKNVWRIIAHIPIMKGQAKLTHSLSSPPAGVFRNRAKFHNLLFLTWQSFPILGLCLSSFTAKIMVWGTNGKSLRIIQNCQQAFRNF